MGFQMLSNVFSALAESNTMAMAEPGNCSIDAKLSSLPV